MLQKPVVFIFFQHRFNDEKFIYIMLNLERVICLIDFNGNFKWRSDQDVLETSSKNRALTEFDKKTHVMQRKANNKYRKQLGFRTCVETLL